MQQSHCEDGTCTYTSIYAVEQAYREGKNKNSFSVLCFYQSSYSEDTYSDTSGCAEDADISVNKKLENGAASAPSQFIPVRTMRTTVTMSVWMEVF
jgi:hypothetical protein